MYMAIPIGVPIMILMQGGPWFNNTGTGLCAGWRNDYAHHDAPGPWHGGVSFAPACGACHSAWRQPAVRMHTPGVACRAVLMLGRGRGAPQLPLRPAAAAPSNLAGVCGKVCASPGCKRAPAVRSPCCGRGLQEGTGHSAPIYSYCDHKARGLCNPAHAAGGLLAARTSTCTELP